MQSFAKFGKKWACIAQDLPKRSQHSIKNRFYHLMAKHLNVTNREVIKSNNNFREEASVLLEKMKSTEKIPNLEIEQTLKQIKKEVIENEKPQQAEKPQQNANSPCQNNQEINDYLNKLQNCFNSLRCNNMPNVNNMFLNFQKFSNVPFSSFNFWPNNNLFNNKH